MFGKVLDVQENLSPGLSRSVFVTFYDREAAARALSVSFSCVNLRQKRFTGPSVTVGTVGIRVSASDFL